MSGNGEGGAGGPKKDKPWIFRTYAGHSTARASNELYRTNLSRGQTGLSIAFDLPTQTGYDSDHVLAKGEVGKVGVPVSHIGDMRALFEGIPMEQMNTSMTINATAAWLLALYIAVADEHGADRKKLQGTVQNDIIKEYLSRGTYVFPPAPSMRLLTDVVSYTYTEVPKWNPTNVCSYHLQEAGATPVQELAFALATAIAVLDRVKAGGQVPEKDFPQVVGRISFFVNAGVRFITEIAKMRAFVDLWDDICRERYGVTDAKLRRFRYGVQVNSLGLTEQQPENNVYRILLEMLAVTLSKNARARAVQLPAWNEALGLPRPWDQQWSLRAQQILAYESDLLEYEDIFDGSKVMDAKVEALKSEARDELARIEEMGGAVAAVESAYMKERLVESNSARLEEIEAGRQIVVGVNKFQLKEEPAIEILDVDNDVVRESQVSRLNKIRETRDEAKCVAALKALGDAARNGTGNLLTLSIEATRARATVGEISSALEGVYGRYQATIRSISGVYAGEWEGDVGLERIRTDISAFAEEEGRRPRLMVVKMGQDGHDRGAKVIATAFADLGFDVDIGPLFQTPQEAARAAIENDVHVIGVSSQAAGHKTLVPQLIEELAKQGGQEVMVVVGGVIPSQDYDFLKKAGVAAIYGPGTNIPAAAAEILSILRKRDQKRAA
jgi:(2R)-ethylmalonyl-CoA mutase